MSERLLAQEEIDALLNAVSTPAETAPAPQEPPRRKQRGATPRPPSRPQPISSSTNRNKGSILPLVRVSTLTKALQNALSLVFDAFSHKASTALSTALRTQVVLELEEMETSSYGEYIESLPEPSSMWYFSLRPHDLQLGICLDPSLVNAMVSLLMGGGKSGILKDRLTVTELEQSLIEPVIAIMLRDLQQAWSRLFEVEMAIESRETRPRLLQVFPQKEATVVVNMKMRVGTTSANLYWGLTAPLLKLISTRLNQQTQLESSKKLSGVIERIKTKVLTVPAHVEVCLEQTPVALSDLLNIKVGDVLKLDHQMDVPVLVKMNNSLRFQGEVVRSGQRRAVRIVQEIVQE